MANPTIVAASLDDKELQQSIANLVAHVKRGLHTMLTDTNSTVNEMEKKLKSLGNLKIDSGGSADGGASKRAKAQNAETDAVEKTITARGKQIKQNQETAMSFDNIASATTKAARSASTFIQSERENLRMRQNEIQAKINSLRKQFGNVEIKTIVRDDGTFSRAVDKAKQKIEEIRRQLQNVPPTSVLGKQFSQELQAARNEYNELIRSRKAFEAKSQIVSLASEYEQNNKKLRELATAYKQLYTDEKQAENAMNNGAAAVARYGDSVEKTQQKLLKASFNRAINILPQGDDLAYAKLERLRAILADHRFLGALSPSEIKRARAEVQKLESQLVDYISKMNSSAHAQQQAANANSQQSRSIDEMNAYIAQNIQREQERRDAIRQTGLAAQQSYRGIVQSAREQLEINTGEPIKGVKELGQAIIEMRRAYYDMSDAERLSPIGQSLLNDIKKAEELRKNLDAFNRNITGIPFRGANNIVDVDKSIGSYANLSKLLKELTSEYQKLGREERNAAKGNDLADKIQRISRETQKIQQQMNRPISLAAAMKGDEKTLDDIAYKMRRLQSYRQGIDLTKPNAANEIKQVDEALAKLQKDADKWMSKSQQMIKNNTALGRSWNYMKNRLAFYFTVGASTSFIKNLIEIRSQYEMNERALGILIDSAERGTQIFNELSQMALVSPYTLIELSTAAKQLTAYDIAAKDVVDTTRRLADMASAVGIPIERLTYALGQIKAYGYLNSRDARMFANAGIPLVKQLSDYYTQLEGRLVSTADVYDRIKKKTIDYEQVVQVINKMTDEGGKFFDFQAKMADTLKVRLANLTLAWNNMLNDIGSSNQGVLTSGIGALREMFLHWKDIESVIKKVTVAFGIYKTAQLVSLLWTGRITTAMGVQELVGKKLQARLASLTATQGGFLSAATTGWAALAFIVADVFLTISRNAEEIERLNKTIADGAKESYESLDKMLHSSEMVSTRLSAAQGKLSDTDAAKAWEILREQIELSAASSKELIAQLLKEPDINKRVTESFNLAEKIEEANRKLSDLSDNLDVTQNSILFGLFGEGLAEDIDDYNERIKYTAEVAEWSAKKNKGFWENATMGLSAIFNEVKDAFGSDSEEAQNEIKNFSKKAAQTIKDELGEEGIKDKIQVNEAIARVVRGMEQQFPQIRGKGKVLFETIFYDTMATEFKGAVDSQAYYYEKFLEQLKKDHASAFSGVTEDINKETFKWSSAQIDAIQKTADKVKRDLPAASQGAIDEILRQLNSTDFKVRIVAEMATTSLDNVQKQFREKFVEKPWIADDKEREKAENEANQRYGTLMRKNTESNVEYEKRISDEKKTQLELSQKNADIISKNQGKEDEFSKAVLADAKKQKEISDDRLKAINEIENKGGYDFSTKSENAAARKAASKAESELAKALKDELSTIDKVRSIYKDLTKEGMSHANAVERATRGWDETVNAINSVLQKNGLQKLDLSKFAGIENPRELVNMLQSQLNTLLKRGAKPAEIKELQTKVNTLEVDADKYDLTKITKGLNNELGKLKDEYELAVELDANPEMGNLFADMFGLDTTEFPKTIDEYMSRVQQEFDDARKSLNLAAPLNIFTANTEQWYNWGKAVGYSEEQVGNFKKSFDGAVGVAKKWAQDVVKQTQDLQYKLADNNGKIAIEEEKLANLRQRLAQETNEEQRRLLELQIQDQQNAIAKLKEEILQLLPTYQRVFGEVAEHSAYMTQKLAKDYKNMLVEGKNRGLNPDNTYSVRDPITGQIARISKDRMGKELKNADKELQKTQSTVKKITEAFTKGEDGVVDWVHGVELVGEELGKLGQFVDVVGNIVDAFGNPNEYNATAEAIHDIATSLQGVDTAAQGIGQIASGDYIGGAVSVASGLFSAISSWFDNSDKKIVAQIKDSEREVKRLENSYKNLEYAIEQAYGMAEYGARRAAIANRQLQLVELQRQLRLEQSRDSKHRDEDRIVELKGQIIDLRNEISQSVDDITNDLLGISSIGDAAEQLVSSMIEAFRQGEDYMKQYDESFEKMIDNMIMKAIVSRVVGDRIEQMWNQVKAVAEQRGAGDQKRIDELTKKLSDAQDVAMNAQSSYEQSLNGGWAQFLTEERKQRLDTANKELERIKAELAQAEKDYAKAIEPTKEDIDGMREMAAGWRDDVKNEFEYWMGAFGIGFGEGADNKQLSALQQGISGITEQQAGALEAYWNSNTQQQFLHSDLLTQIRDIMVGWDFDVQLGTLSQILLQLQTNYTVMMSMQSLMEGWTTPSGQGIRVELIS